MNIGKTLFAQLMDFLLWSTFARIVARYGGDARVRTLCCAEQYRAMAFAQLTGRESLRDIERLRSRDGVELLPWASRAGLAVDVGRRQRVARLAHLRRLGAEPHRPARELYAREDLGLEIAQAIYALDSTTIDLCLVAISVGAVSQRKGAVKLHTLLDLRGSIPARYYRHAWQGARRQDPRRVDLRSRRDLHHGSRLRRLRETLRDESAAAFFVTRAKSNLDAIGVCTRAPWTKRARDSDADQTSRIVRREDQRRLPESFAPNRLRGCRIETKAGHVSDEHFMLPALTIATSTRSAGGWNSSSSGSNSIFGSRRSTARRRTP